MIIAFIFILAGIIFMIGTLVYIRNKNNLKNIKFLDKSNSSKIKKKLTTLWGINDIHDQIVSINKNQHSIIVELESIEYNLLHNEEKISVDRELISISQMLKYPIQFLEIKQKIDMEETIEEIQLNIINSNDYIKEYGKNIIEHLRKIENDEDLFERKNYMIISSFDNLKTAEKELKEFYQTLRYHLINIKVSTRLLNDDEILELIYKQLHKGSKNKIKEIQEKGGLELYVKAKKREKNKTI